VSKTIPRGLDAGCRRGGQQVAGGLIDESTERRSAGRSGALSGAVSAGLDLWRSRGWWGPGSVSDHS